MKKLVVNLRKFIRVVANELFTGDDIANQISKFYLEQTAQQN